MEPLNAHTRYARVVIPDFLYIYCFPNSSHSLLAAVAREDYEDRHRRQAQGITKAKAAGAYRGRPEDTDRNAGIAGMPRSGMS